MITPCPSPCLGILRYSAGNVGSVQRALTRLGIPSRIIQAPQELEEISGLVFPGAGAAPSAMESLRKYGLEKALLSFDRPFLGLCLGMQLLFDFSEEGNTTCLGIIRGIVKELPGNAIKPHMGWNKLQFSSIGLQPAGGTGNYAYFVHNYVCVPTNPSAITMTTKYGADICAGVQERNFFGVQWHPEKSGAIGDRYLLAFATLCREHRSALHSHTLASSPCAP